MSLEESMSTLAESNLKLAAAMTNYANVMQGIASSNPGAIVAAPAGEAAATEDKPKGTRRTKAQIAEDAKAEVAANAAAAELDPFADEPAAAPAKEVTAADIRELIMQVKAKDTDAALKIIKDVGAATLSQIAEKDYDKVVKLCAKHGVTL